ncbi:glycosyltransferase [Halomonas sp. Y3]|uniref:glycosyltransferase n=1 Tax=Halomonas sp. Y3 TaxID=2956797 RepID=UPI00209FB5D1|nr:glycosyltransferase [Halomonas sp. Y3]
MKEKIDLICLPTSNLGGAERYLYNIALYSAKNNPGKTFVLVGSRGDNGSWEDLKKVANVVFFPAKRELTSLPFWIFFLISYSAKYDVQYVLSSHAHINGMLSFLRRVRLIRPKFFISRESTVLEDRFSGARLCFYRFIYKFLYGTQNIIICQTEYMKDRYSEGLLRSLAHKLRVLENPVNFSYIQSSLSNIQAQSVFSNLNHSGQPLDFKKIFDHSFVLGCACRLIDSKNVDSLVFAFKSIFDDCEGVVDGKDMKLLIVGDGESKSYLQTLVEDHGLQGSVFFLGRVEAPYWLYANFDVGVVPSLVEGFPNVLLEMMASGTKMLVTTPCADGLQELPCVRVTKGFDADDIRAEILACISSKRDYSESYSEYSSKRSLDNFWNALDCHLSNVT